MHKIDIVKLTKDQDPDEVIKQILDKKYFPRFKYR